MLSRIRGLRQLLQRRDDFRLEIDSLAPPAARDEVGAVAPQPHPIRYAPGSFCCSSMAAIVSITNCGHLDHTPGSRVVFVHHRLNVKGWDAGAREAVLHLGNGSVPAQPAAIGHAQQIQGVLDGLGSITSGLAQLLPGLVAVARDAGGVQALTAPPARLLRKSAGNDSLTAKRKRG